MNKAFTLVELLAVITILAIILVLVVPNVINLISGSKTKTYNEQVARINKAAETYITENPYAVTYTSNIAYVTLNTLVNAGYLDSPINNPKTGNNFSLEGTYVKITKSSSSYSFAVTTTITNSLDTSGASSPELASNMIPVYYNGGWKKADSTNTNTTYKWYDYTNKIWANAVTVTDASRSTYQSAAAGTTILEADILTYMVWIPRYKYYITTSGTATPSSIGISFESSTTTKSTGIATSNTTYRTHPAFTFGGKELSGIWVGKFEISGSLSSIHSVYYALPIRNTTVSDFFNAIKNMEKGGNYYGYLAEEVDTHMIKNSEWGAAAYLGYSIYGKNSEVWINNNSATLITGCAGATVSAASNVGCANPYNTTTGGYASTTGNIYGIYDMSGGSWEYVMGNYGNYISSSGFSELPAAKYYDVYTTSEGTTACGGGICYGQAISETLNWNSDYYYPATSSGPWVVRGANFTGTTSAGIFSLSYKTGSVAGDTSTRIVVTME